MSASSRQVTLEGKSRLPSRVQDLIIDLGSAVASIQHASGSNETLAMAIRNFAAVDGIMNNSAQNLEKISRQLDRLEGQMEDFAQMINATAAEEGSRGKRT